MSNIRWTEYEKRILANAAYPFYENDLNVNLLNILRFAQATLPENRKRKITSLRQVPWFKSYIENIELQNREILINDLIENKVNNKENVEILTRRDIIEILNNFENKLNNSIENIIKKTINSLNIPETVADYIIDELLEQIKAKEVSETSVSNIVSKPSIPKSIPNTSIPKSIPKTSTPEKDIILPKVNVSIKNAVHHLLDSTVLINDNLLIEDTINILDTIISKSECLEMIQRIENDGLDFEINIDLYTKLINQYLTSNYNKKIRVSIVGIHQDQHQFIRTERINPLFKNLIDIKIWNNGKNSNSRTILRSMSRNAELTYILTSHVGHSVTDTLKNTPNVTYILHSHGISSLKKEIELGVFKYILNSIIDK